MTQDNSHRHYTLWHDVAALKDLDTATPRRVEIGDHPVLLVRRENGELRALDAECPHKGAPLEQGVVCGVRLICPWHKATFSIDDGRLLEPLSLEPLKSYPIEIREDRVFVSLRASMPASAPKSGHSENVLIVGSGAAGVAAAVSLREFSFAGKITMVEMQDAEPYV